MTRKQQTPQPLSPVFAKGEAARPRVQAPDSPMTVWVGVGGALVLGFMVFNGLSSGREAKAQTAPAPVAAAPQPAPAPVPAPAPAPAPVAAPAPIMQAPVRQPDPEAAHWRAPTMVVDFSSPEGQALQLAQATQTPGTPGAQVIPGQSAIDARAQSADERFSARVTGSLGDVARASQMRDLGRVVPQGTVIAAVLETAINSDLPGSVRGVVSRDVRSFDGSRVLIPRGSKLVGQYKSAAAQGQTRAFVVWERIISPTGVTIEVGSPATDRLGRGGLSGDVDRHFFQRFGAAILLTTLQAGATALADGNGSTVIIGGASSQTTQVGATALQQQVNIPDTIKVAQGVPVQVFVARDLDFGGVVR
ncbi:type IV secretion system protein VirB10 [Phenylobacterium sp.]|uniref:type IV secretion system protein VirB10 n=1 Tax=Phenylobacterium sp. TaxID=1871053 RepID=UPI002ED89D73